MKSATIARLRPRSSGTSANGSARRLGYQRRHSSHMARLSMLNSTVNTDTGVSYTYPKNSPVINERHFYQNAVLIDWVKKTPRPVSLRQLAFFGNKLNSDKIVSSANFVRTELAVRLAHRIRDMQQLPFAVVSNHHISQVYEQYFKAFDRFRKFPTIGRIEDNDEFCQTLTELLDEHLSIIPNLVIGAIECDLSGSLESDRLDQFMSSMLCSRISRRVIAEQHLSLSRTFRVGNNDLPRDPNFIGEVFLQCSARDSIERCARKASALIQDIYPEAQMPKVEIEGGSEHEDATFPYIRSHLDYILGELLRNSIEATVKATAAGGEAHPVTVSVSNTADNVFIRISDRGGGIPQDILPHVWSFAKGPRSVGRLELFKRVPTYAGLSSEVKTHFERSQPQNDVTGATEYVESGGEFHSSLSSLAARSPHVKLGMGLPLSRVYAEYWGGALDLHSLEGYGCDAFLRISRLGTQMEQLSLDRV